jgi:hypothetical protein
LQPQTPDPARHAPQQPPTPAPKTIVVLFCKPNRSTRPPFEYEIYPEPVVLDFQLGRNLAKFQR